MILRKGNVMMKRIIKTIGTVAGISIIALGSYLLGTTQAETVTEIKTVTETKEVIPDGYIDTNSVDFRENYVDMRKVTYFEVVDGLQLYYADGSEYYWE